MLNPIEKFKVAILGLNLKRDWNQWQLEHISILDQVSSVRIYKSNGYLSGHCKRYRLMCANQTSINITLVSHNLSQ